MTDLDERIRRLMAGVAAAAPDPPPYPHPSPLRRQPRTRVLAHSAAVVVIVVAVVVGIGLYLDHHHSQTVTVTTPPTVPRVSGGAGSGAHWVYFRPVECQISPVGPTASPVTPSIADCSNDQQAQMANTPAVSETQSGLVILPTIGGESRYLLGPTDLATEAIAAAKVVPPQPGGQGYEVEIDFTNTGDAEFNGVASQRYPYYIRNTDNPPYASLEAVEVDGTTISIRSIPTNHYHGSITLTGPSGSQFSKEQATQIIDDIRNDLTNR
jgi:hypothetical protein